VWPPGSGPATRMLMRVNMEVTWLRSVGNKLPSVINMGVALFLAVILVLLNSNTEA
jgi:hypothetical protein